MGGQRGTAEVRVQAPPPHSTVGTGYLSLLGSFCGGRAGLRRLAGAGAKVAVLGLGQGPVSSTTLQAKGEGRHRGPACPPWEALSFSPGPWQTQRWHLPWPGTDIQTPHAWSQATLRGALVAASVLGTGTLFSLPRPCAPVEEARPLSPPRARAQGGERLVAHLLPTLQGAAEKSEREAGALCQDL